MYSNLYSTAHTAKCLQGTVFWRARLKVDKSYEKPQWFFGDEK